MFAGAVFKAMFTGYVRLRNSTGIFSSRGIIDGLSSLRQGCHRSHNVEQMLAGCVWTRERGTTLV
jgi:hypothetical protein